MHLKQKKINSNRMHATVPFTEHTLVDCARVCSLVVMYGDMIAMAGDKNPIPQTKPLLSELQH